MHSLMMGLMAVSALANLAQASIFHFFQPTSRPTSAQPTSGSPTIGLPHCFVYCSTPSPSTVPVPGPTNMPVSSSPSLPSSSPTNHAVPSNKPTNVPSKLPTSSTKPSQVPTTKSSSSSPSSHPTTRTLTHSPSQSPTLTSPASKKTLAPSDLLLTNSSSKPSSQASLRSPSMSPSMSPSVSPSMSPSVSSSLTFYQTEIVMQTPITVSLLMVGVIVAIPFLIDAILLSCSCFTIVSLPMAWMRLPYIRVLVKRISFKYSWADYSCTFSYIGFVFSMFREVLIENLTQEILSLGNSNQTNSWKAHFLSFVIQVTRFTATVLASCDIQNNKLSAVLSLLDISSIGAAPPFNGMEVQVPYLWSIAYTALFLFLLRSLVRFVLASIGCVARVYDESVRFCTFEQFTFRWWYFKLRGKSLCLPSIKLGTHVKLFFWCIFSIFDPWYASLSADCLMAAEVKRNLESSKEKRESLEAPGKTDRNAEEDVWNKLTYEKLFESKCTDFFGFYTRAVQHGLSLEIINQRFAVAKEDPIKKKKIQEYLNLRKELWIASKEFYILTLLLIVDKAPLLALLVYYFWVSAPLVQTNVTSYVTFVVLFANFIMQVWEWFQVVRIRQTLILWTEEKWCEIANCSFHFHFSFLYSTNLFFCVLM